MAIGLSGSGGGVKGKTILSLLNQVIIKYFVSQKRATKRG